MNKQTVREIEKVIESSLIKVYNIMVVTDKQREFVKLAAQEVKELLKRMK